MYSMCDSYRQYRRVVYISLQTSKKLLALWKKYVALASGLNFHPEDRCDWFSETSTSLN